MSGDSTVASIPSDLAEFISFFESELADVRFPDVDRESLAELAADVRAKAGELERLSAQVRTAREALEQAQSELRKTATRGLAYATVYAGDDEELSTRLAELSLSRGSSESKPVAKPKKPRGRKPKDSEAAAAAPEQPTAELPFAERPPTGKTSKAAAKAALQH